MILIGLIWAAFLGYPVLQALALWQARGGWRTAAWIVLFTFGLGYLWCIVVFAGLVSPLLTGGGNLAGLFEMMGLMTVGPVALVALSSDHRG